MKKILFIVLLSSSFSYSQLEYRYDKNSTTLPYWVQEMYSENPDPRKVELLYEDFYKKNKFIKNKHTQYYKRWQRFLSREINVSNDYKSNYKNKKTVDLPVWECIGPFDFDRNAASTSYAAGAAHLYTVEQSISNTNILYAGGATCGLWKSVDKGLHWIPLLDTELMINEVYSLEIDFTNPDVVYFSALNDLYTTNDGGETYSLLYNLGFINDIVMNPSNNNILYICSDEGLYRLNIEENNLEILLNGETLELEFHPTYPNIIYTIRQTENKTDFLKSLDSGETFNIYDNGWPNPNSDEEQRRTEIAVSPDNPDRIVALATGSANNGSGLYGVYVSDNQGENWEFRCCGTQPAGIPSEENINLMGWSHEGLDDGGQYYYDLALAINPNNADNIHVGGINHWVSNDGGYTFTCPSKWSWAADEENTKYVHADIHDIKYYNDDLWIACDGGIFYSNNQGDTIHQRMFGIAGTDFWGFGAGFSDGNVMIGGTYHNATLLKDNNTYIQGDTLEGTNEFGGWVSVCGGDNYRGFVNFGDNRKVYLDEWDSGGGYILSGDRTVPLVGFPMSVLSNASYTTGRSSNLEFDPRCYNIIYIGNGDILYKSYNNGYSAFPLYEFNDKVTSIEVGWNDPDLIYVATYNSYTSNVWKSEDGGINFIDITPSFEEILNDEWIPYDITVSSEDDNMVWIARCPSSLGYDSYQGNQIYESMNRGEDWINITSSELDGENLTNIEFHRGSNKGIYLGTRKNVYYKNASMTNWILFNNGLPASTYSTQLVPYYKEEKLKNGTNRSVWEVNFFESFQPSAQIAADKLVINCLNDTIQFVNHSAMSNSEASFSWVFPGGNPSYSTEENPKVIYSEEGLYNVYLQITDAYGSDNDTIIDMIQYTNNPFTMEGFGCDGNCQEGFLNATLIAEDSYGDGWNGNTLSIIVNDTLFTQKTLEDGYYSEIDLCIPSDPNLCIQIIVEIPPNTESWPEEVSWSIINNNYNISGGSPYIGQLYDSCPVYGCTDQNAINYDPNADTDDESCCLGSFYTILMEDSYGDGWNGNTLIINDYQIELEEGYEGEETICLEGINCFNIICDGGDWQNEVSWTIYNDLGDIIISGGAPYSGCFLEGCTDPLACNYNIEATNNDESCEYPDENGDCNNILIDRYEKNPSEIISITDIIGRRINNIRTGQIYLINRLDGKTEKKINFK